MTLSVLHVTSTIDRSAIGITSHLSDLVMEQKQMGYQVIVAAAWRKDDDVTWAERLRSHGVQVELIGPVKGKLGKHKSMASLIQRHMKEVNVIHLHGVFSQIILDAASSAKNSGKPYIWHCKGELNPEKWEYKLIRRWTYQKHVRPLIDSAAAVHMSSQFEIELAAKLRIAAPRVVESIGIDMKPYRDLPETGAFRRSLQIEDDARIVLCLGHMTMNNGIALLTQSIANIRSGNFKIYLVVAGTFDNGVKDQLLTYANGLGMLGRLVCMPPLIGQQRLSAFRDATLTVLPWTYDLHSQTVLESLSTGTPVILTNGCALHHEALEHRFAGVVAQSRVDMTREIIRFLNSESLRTEMCENGMRWLKEFCSLDMLAKRWDALYKGKLPKSIGKADELGRAA